MIPRFRPQYSLKELRASFSFFQKDCIPNYEQQFAEKFECRYGVMFAHGRSGLYSLLKIWGLENTEVICPAYTCVVVPHAIVISGNKPVFVDCAAGHFNMSIEGIKRAITERTRVIIPTHLFGYPMDVLAVQRIADEASAQYGHKVYVVQDCAHSYGARWNGELVTAHGDAAIFGCNISKIINSIFGGMVTTSNEKTDRALRAFRERTFRPGGFSKTLRRLLYFLFSMGAFNPWLYGLVNCLERKRVLDYFVKYYDEKEINFPADWDLLPSDIEARVGLEQLKKYDFIVEGCVNQAKEYLLKFKDRDDIFVLPFDSGSTYSHFVALVKDRGAWLKKYQERHIQLGMVIEYVIPYMSAYQDYATEDYPVAACYKDCIINFPVH